MAASTVYVDAGGAIGAADTAGMFAPDDNDQIKFLFDRYCDRRRPVEAARALHTMKVFTSSGSSDASAILSQSGQGLCAFALLEIGLAYPLTLKTEVAMPELSPEGEAIAAYDAATMAALKILVICLQSNGALEHGQFPEALRLFMEAAKDDADEMTLSILHDLRASILE